MDDFEGILGTYEDAEDKTKSKHCKENGCDAHWIPDPEDSDQLIHCVECGSDDIEDCDDPLCAQSAALEKENFAYARQEYPGRLVVSKRKNKKDIEEDFVEYYFKTYTGEEMKLGDYDKNGYRMIGVGLKGLEAVMALWITPQGKGNPMLKMDSGVTFKDSSPYFEGYTGGMDRANPFPAFREGKDKNGVPFGTRTSLDNYDKVVELFEAQCDKYGCKKEPRIWIGAERAVEDAKAARTPSGGGGKGKVPLTPIGALEMQFVNGEIDDKTFIARRKLLLG